MEIKLLNFLTGNCDAKGCIHNLGGECACNDKDFFEERLEDVMDALILNVISTNKYFECYHAKSDGLCLECGNPLEKVEQYEEVWGARQLVNTYYECPYGH